MNTIFLQTHLQPHEIEQLHKEFSQFLFLSLVGSSRPPSYEDWSHIEILYGNELTLDQLSHAHNLRWIHSPTQNLDNFTLEAIAKRGNIILTSVMEENDEQVGEFVMAGLLGFSKHLFHWAYENRLSTVTLAPSMRDSIWTLGKRLFVQLGLGRRGSEIARRAQKMNMRVWGISHQKTFHPFCDKTLAFKDLHSILPVADVVSITLPIGQQASYFFKRNELALMKDDSILIMVGANNLVNEEDLVAVGSSGKFRGILYDSPKNLELSCQSPLWQIPRILITPGVATKPESKTESSYPVFRYNLRQYLRGNFTEMRNNVNLTPAKEHGQ